MYRYRSRSGPRRFSRVTRTTTRYTGATKYTTETQAGTTALVAQTQSNLEIVPAAGITGVRKVKHITLNLGSDVTAQSYAWYVLVFVPEGQNQPRNMSTQQQAGASIYEPNQHVMARGIIQFAAGTNRISTPLARNLNAGDRIYLCLVPNQNMNVAWSCQYAITFN